MSYFIDVAFDSLNKFGEELCGDNVEVIYTDKEVIVVLADGLGSGVKANILATLTSKIAGTMLKEGASLDETVDTMVHTLPVCNVRKLAYSTFTIVKIDYEGHVHMIEYDNPPFFLHRKDEEIDIKRESTPIQDKVIYESHFTIQDGDLLTIVSDGVIHAGVGALLNLGWQWENVNDYLASLSIKEKCSSNVARGLIETCKNLYMDKPGDDTTVVAIKIREAEVVDLFTGPPKDSNYDSSFIKQFLKGKSKKVICGGTAAKIAARELNKELQVDINYLDKDVPPIAYIQGIDLVTEGVLTLSKTVEKIRQYVEGDYFETMPIFLQKQDGASLLARLLIEDCTHLHLWVGKAVNPAHQNPDFPIDLSIKLKIVKELANWMEAIGKKVTITYI
ncbi:MAG: serine/threonine-protein phosphatase [Epulopiscium sp.]|nr:serine/threonine-protein phosphatase [Candidatus Epulonipiscium sp.]